MHAIRFVRTATILFILFALSVLSEFSTCHAAEQTGSSVALRALPAFDLQKAQSSSLNASVDASSSAPLLHFHPGSERASVQFNFPSIDLSQAAGIDLHLANPGHHSLRVYAMLNANAWASDYVVVPSHSSAELRIYFQRTTFEPACLRAAYPKMNGLPGGAMTLWPDANIDPASIRSLTVYSIGLHQPAELRIDAVQGFPPSLDGEAACAAHAFVDRYGQNSLVSWPGKTLSDAQLRQSAIDEEGELRHHPAPASYDRFGGWRGGPQLAATGHFRVVKRQGRWWFVDPDGHLFWSNGITTILYHAPTDVEGRLQLFKDPAPGGDFLARNLALKYGAGWSSAIQDRTIVRLRSWGLNTIGPWSDEDLTAKQRAVYTYVISSRGESGKIDPYSPQWYQNLRKQLQEHAALNNDPWCLGIYIDNEIHDSMDAQWWTAYYQKVHELMRELMPNKLYLGSRLDFADFPRVDEAHRNVVRLAAQYTDVISMNQYRFTLEDFALPEGIDRPVMVGEFHFGALDRGLLHTGLRSVRNQSQRADAYTHYIESALRNPNFVGVHWFQMYDEPVTGRGDGENYQIGFLDICDHPYPETIAASRRLAARLYDFRVHHKAFTH